jgi:hypothetical protein
VLEDQERIPTLATFPDGSPSRQRVKGPLVVRYINHESGASVVRDLTGDAFIDTLRRARGTDVATALPLRCRSDALADRAAADACVSSISKASVSTLDTPVPVAIRSSEAGDIGVSAAVPFRHQACAIPSLQRPRSNAAAGRGGGR